jgi:hypothetical protein
METIELIKAEWWRLFTTCDSVSAAFNLVVPMILSTLCGLIILVKFSCFYQSFFTSRDFCVYICGFQLRTPRFMDGP